MSAPDRPRRPSRSAVQDDEPPIAADRLQVRVADAAASGQASATRGKAAAVKARRSAARPDPQSRAAAAPANAPASSQANAPTAAPARREPHIADASASPSRDGDGKTAKPTQKLDQSALRHVLGYHLSLADVPSKRLFFRYIGEPLKLRPVEFSLLVLVRDNREATQKQLGQALSLAAPNLTLLLDKLEERGLITRERSLQDRRAQHVRLTPAGDQLARAGHEASFAMEREWTRALSDAERAMLAELLRKMARLGAV